MNLYELFKTLYVENFTKSKDIILKNRKTPEFIKDIIKNDWVSVRREIKRTKGGVLNSIFNYWSPLQFLMAYTRPVNLKMVLFFLKNGANPNYKNNTGQTPLSIAVMYGDNKLISLLKSYGAEIEDVYPKKDKDKNKIKETHKLYIKTIIRSVIKAFNVKDEKKAITLLNSKRDIPIDYVHKGKSLIVIAFQKGLSSVVKFLLSKKVDWEKAVGWKGNAQINDFKHIYKDLLQTNAK